MQSPSSFLVAVCCCTFPQMHGHQTCLAPYAVYSTLFIAYHISCLAKSYHRLQLSLRQCSISMLESLWAFLIPWRGFHVIWHQV